MTAPRLDTPDLGEPIDASNPIAVLSSSGFPANSTFGASAVEPPAHSDIQGKGIPTSSGLGAFSDSKPSQPSPLTGSPVTAGDLDPTSQAAPSSTTATGHGPVENLLSAVGGAAVAAPGAAFSALTGRTSDLLDSVKGNSTSGTPIADKFSTATSQFSEQAKTLAANASEQAAALLSQAREKLPEGVREYIPDNLVAGGAAASTKTVNDGPQFDVTSETRETTSAPIVDSNQSDRPGAISKPLVPESEPSTSVGGMPLAGVVTGDKTDITQGHTTGTFQAAGELQATHNPEIVEAQSDLAVRAENGDL